MLNQSLPHRQLNELQRNVCRLGTMVEALIYQTVQALKYDDKPLAESMIQRDQQLEHLRLATEQRCYALWSLSTFMPAIQPRLVTTLSIISELRIMADCTAHIAAAIAQLTEEPDSGMKDDLAQMASLCRTMLREALTSFCALDTCSAGPITDRQQRISLLHHRLLANVEATAAGFVPSQKEIVDDLYQISQSVIHIQAVISSGEMEGIAVQCCSPLASAT